MTDHPSPEIDLLVSNGRVLTMDDQGTEIDNGAVAVAGDRIAAVGTADAFRDQPARRIIDANGGIIMPGLINTHTHAAMTCFRGLADDLPLMTWLNEHIFPAEAGLDDEKVFLGTLLACAEMIRSGTTCFCDMYLFEDAVARGAAAAGMRAVVGEVLYDFPSPNYGPIEKGFDYTRSLLDHWAGHPLVNIAVEPHSPYLCSPDLLETAVGLAEDHDMRLIVHVSETADEMANSLRDHGKTPVAHLAALGALIPNLLACHCVHLTEDDIRLLASHDVKVAHNPESNMKLASGVAPVPELLAAGVCVGLGTDGCASNNDLDLFVEMDSAAKLHKVHRLDPTVLPAGRVLQMATRDGARALGLDDVTGSLEEGKRADLIVIDTRKPHLTPLYHAASQLVYAAAGSDVASVVINGQVVMADRDLLTLDLAAIYEAVGQLADGIRRGAGGRRYGA